MSSSPPSRRNPKQPPLRTSSPPNPQPLSSSYTPQTQPQSSMSQQDPRPEQPVLAPQPPSSPPMSRKRKAPMSATAMDLSTGPPASMRDIGEEVAAPEDVSSPVAPKKSRTNTPWTPAEEQRLKIMRDSGNSWSDIAKTFPSRTEGSVKKHWYKDMHYADFAADEEAALLAAIKDYEANKWKVIGQKVGKPAKACEQFAKEHFPGRA